MNRREAVLRLAAVAAGMRLGPAPAFALDNTEEAIRSGSRFDSYMFGVSYYPEQWPAMQVREDFRKMREIGVNLVRMGEFAWSSIQPSAKSFNFAWLDRAIDLASQNGIAVILGTPTASVPPWLYKLHPDVLSGNEKGAYTYGGRKGFAVDSPAMRAAASDVITQLSSRYGGHPAVIGWQLSNEPGYPMVNYDHASLLQFRLWLKQRYGALEKLNAAWSGVFWSNTYDAWDEIVFPTNSAEGGWNAGIRIDYRRFFSESFLRWLRFEASIVKQHAHKQFIYTNWPEVAWSVDIFEAARFLDATAWDNYGAMPGTASIYDVLNTAFNHDLCRASRADQRFFVAEQPTQPTAGTDARPIRLTMWADVAYGSRATVFFEFRAPLAGSEMGYVSMLEPDGSFGASVPLLQNTFKEITRLDNKLAKARTVADIALIYSYENSWDQRFRVREGSGVGAGYDNVANRYYTGMKFLKRNVDIIPMSRDVAPYRMVVAPGLRIVSDEAGEQLSRWVKAGGILVLDHKAGTRSPDGRLRPLVEPGVFSALSGIQVPGTEREAGTPHTVSFTNALEKFTVADAEVVLVKEGESLAHYHGGSLAGQPAITLHREGLGFVVFVSFSCRQEAFFDALFAAIARRFSILPLLAVPKEVDVVSRTNGKSEFIFLLNNSHMPVEIEILQPFTELLTNVSVDKHLSLEALQVAVLERTLNR